MCFRMSFKNANTCVDVPVRMHHHLCLCFFSIFLWRTVSKIVCIFSPPMIYIPLETNCFQSVCECSRGLINITVWASTFATYINTNLYNIKGPLSNRHRDHPAFTPNKPTHYRENGKPKCHSGTRKRTAFATFDGKSHDIDNWSLRTGLPGVARRL